MVNLDKSIVLANAITSGRYNFSACQLDILFMLLALLKNTDPADKVYKIHVKDIEDITGRQWQYNQLQEATAEMGSKMFAIETPEMTLQLWLFSGVIYHKGKGYFDMVISSMARPYLFNLKNNFTVMQVRSALSCSSKYAKRLYAMACQWKTIGEVTLPISDLKEMLYLKDPNNNVSEQFKNIMDFKRFVLEIAKHQINQNTDIKFDYQLIKFGRSFREIKMTIERQKFKQLGIDFKEEVDYQKNVNTIVAYGLSEAVAKKVAVKHFKAFIKIKDELNQQIKSGKFNIENNTAYLMGVLKNKKII